MIAGLVEAKLPDQKQTAPAAGDHESSGGSLTHPRYRGDIDGLRAIAVLSVVGFHAFPRWVKGGFVGVDIFFVISGFLISNIIFSNLDRGRFTFREFYARRIRRIFPALAVVLIACYAFGWFALLAVEYKQLGRNIAAGAGFVSNLLSWSEAGYFDIAADTKPLLHLWSLGIEEQFYLLWPLMVYLAWKAKFNRLLLTLSVVVVSFALSVILSGSHRVADFYGPATRFWELSIGSALAYITLYRRNTQKGAERRPEALWGTVLRDVKSAVGCALLVAAVFTLTKDSVFPGWLALLPTVGTYFLIAAGPEAWLNRNVLSRSPLAGIGLISFPLYLWHWPILSFLRVIGSGPPARSVKIGAVIVSGALAWLTYRLVERPIRFGGRGEAKVVVLCAAMFIIGGVGHETYLHDGFGFRLQAFEEQLYVIRTVVESSPECKASLPLTDLRYCLVADPARPVTVALFGDSHANRFFVSLSERYQQAGGNLLAIGGAGCLPFWNIETGLNGERYHCDQRMAPQLDYLLNSPSTKKVIFMHRGPVHVEGVDLFASGNFLLENTHDGWSGKSREDIYRNALIDTLRRFNDAGKEVVVVIDAPEFSFDTTQCLDLVRPFASPFVHRPDCRLRRADVDARNKRYIEISAAAARGSPHARLVNLQHALCDEKYCYAIRDGQLLYRDADHLNQFGAEYVVSRLWNEF